MERRTKDMIVAGVGLFGIILISAGLAGFFGWPGALIGAGSALYVMATTVEKIGKPTIQIETAEKEAS